MDEPYRIRRATPADAAALARVSSEAFLETFVDEFAIPYPADDLAAFMADSHSEAAFTEWLAEPRVAAWIAETAHGEACGYALTGPVSLPHAEARDDEIELHRLYLTKAHRGSGLGPKLMDAAMEFDGHGPVVWLGVWSENFRAQRFYARYGFEKAGEYEFPVGRHLDHEFILRRRGQAA